MGRSVLAIITLTLCAADLAWTYSWGVPDQACYSMRPGHLTDKSNYSSKIEPLQNGGWQYKIVPESYYVVSGESITVTISAEYDSFRGFLLQAHDEWGNYDGEFMTYDGQAQAACYQSAASHNSNGEKYSVQAIWTAPYVDYGKNFYFSATIVKDYSNFYVDVRSDTIWVDRYSSGSAPATFTPFSASMLLLVAMATRLFGQL